MDLHQYIGRVASSSPNDWTVILGGAYGGGPSFRDEFSVLTKGIGEFVGLEVRSHTAVASFKSDLSFGLAWGLESNPDFTETWTSKFSDPHAGSCYLDFFYNGSLVLRELLVAVDGGRCYLPLPLISVSGQVDEASSLTVPRRKSDVIRIVNALTCNYNYDQYVVQSGLDVVDDDWP
jgi:hypothetical protein